MYLSEFGVRGPKIFLKIFEWDFAFGPFRKVVVMTLSSMAPQNFVNVEKSFIFRRRGLSENFENSKENHVVVSKKDFLDGSKCKVPLFLPQKFFRAHNSELRCIDEKLETNFIWFSSHISLISKLDT